MEKGKMSEDLSCVVTYVFSKYRGITSFQTQYVIYNALKEYKKTDDKLLFDDEIVALPIGNVILSLYEHYQHAFFSMTNHFEDIRGKLSKDITDLLDKYINEVNTIDPLGYDFNKIGNKDELWEKTMNEYKGDDNSWKLVNITDY